MTHLGDTSPTGDDVVKREEKEVRRSNKSTCGSDYPLDVEEAERQKMENKS